MLVSCTIELPEEVKKQIENETRTMFDLHPEYLWYDSTDYRIPIYSWPNVETDLTEKLSDKIATLLFEQKPFTLSGLRYAVKISNRIDIVLQFQEDKKCSDLVESIETYFNQGNSSKYVPLLPVARYKIPSKQQYSHLKNRLEKIKTAVEIPVNSLSLCKVTDFGNGIRKYEDLKTIKIEY